MCMKYGIVTGSTKGIGKAIAEKLLSEGWFVFLNYANDDVSAEEFREAHKEEQERYMIIKQNLSSYDSVQLFIKKILSVTNQIDCVVLNAGATDRTPFDDITPQGWEYVINTNINAPFYMVHGLREHIVEDTGRIIFIGSVCGKYPHAGSIAYGVTKAAIHDMASELVKFFAPKRITVNAVAPGFTNTPWQVAKKPEHRKSIENKIALHRFAEAEEIASLCWEVINNQYINGATLQIDGGYSYF